MFGRLTTPAFSFAPACLDRCAVLLALLFPLALAWVAYACVDVVAQEKHFLGYPPPFAARRLAWACLLCGATQVPLHFGDQASFGWVRRSLLIVSWIVALPSVGMLLAGLAVLPGGLIAALVVLQDPDLLSSTSLALAVAPALPLALVRMVLDL